MTMINSNDGNVDDEWWLSAFYGAALLVAFVVAIFTCVCNPRSKRSAAFTSTRKHQSFVLSHDLPAQEVPPTNVDHLAITTQSVGVGVPSSLPSSANTQQANIAQGCSVHQQQPLQHNRMGSSSSYCSCGANQQAQVPVGDTVDCGCNKLKANRALPDIPGPDGGGGEKPQQQHPNQQLPFSNSTSVDDVDSLYTVAHPVNTSTAAATNDSNHPYARIHRSNGHHPLQVDSSTENDTDDYSVDGGRIPPPSNEPPSVQYHPHPSPSHGGGGQFRQSMMVASNNNPIEEVNAYELEPVQSVQPHILRLQLRSNGGNEPSNVTESGDKVEISYNTISVREPLSKVLADGNREAAGNTIEHHYNEVEEEEEERLSSFYEEIANASGGSSTYSKIPEPMPSTSRESGSFRGVTTKATTSSSSVVVANCGPVYSFVDKKSKKRTALPPNPNRSPPPQPPPPPPEVNNLYTMVVKSPAKNASSSLAANSNTFSDSSKPIALQRYSPPPPLPPPLPHSTQPKATYRNTIMFGTPSAGHNYHNNHPPHHQQYPHNLADLHDYNTISHDGPDGEEMIRPISPHQPPDQHLYQKITSKKGSKRPPQPPPPPAHPDPFSPEEKDPGYEVVVDRSEKPPALDNNSYGYEAIRLDESEEGSDSAYEIVKPENRNGERGCGSTDDDNSPAYETIKNESSAVYSRVDELKRGSRDLEEEDDGDPNYEIIVNNHPHHRHQQQPRSAQQPMQMHNRPAIHLTSHPSTNDSTMNGLHNRVNQHNLLLHQHHHHHHLHHVHHHQIQTVQLQQQQHQSLQHNHHNHYHPHHHRTTSAHVVHSPNTGGLLIDENVIIEHL